MRKTKGIQKKKVRQKLKEHLDDVLLSLQNEKIKKRFDKLKKKSLSIDLSSWNQENLNFKVGENILNRAKKVSSSLKKRVKSAMSLSQKRIKLRKTKVKKVVRSRKIES